MVLSVDEGDVGYWGIYSYKIEPSIYNGLPSVSGVRTSVTRFSVSRGIEGGNEVGGMNHE